MAALSGCLFLIFVGGCGRTHELAATAEAATPVDVGEKRAEPAEAPTAQETSASAASAASPARELGPLPVVREDDGAGELPAPPPSVDGYSASGSLWGLIGPIDLGRGTLTLNSGGGDHVLLHGRPEQLLAWKPGDEGVVTYVDHAGISWLAWDPTTTPELPRAELGHSGVIIGAIAEVNLARGAVVLDELSGKRTYRAHPEQLTSLIPGLTVRLEYSQIAGHDWIRSVTVEKAAGSGAQP